MPQTEAADSIVAEEYTTAFGRVWFDSNDFEKALATYEQADTASMTAHDLSNYAMAAFFKQQYQKSLDLVRYGLTRKPGHAPFNRLAFFCCTELKQYDAARKYADALFLASPPTPLFYYDYHYLVRFLTATPHPVGTDKARLMESYYRLINYYLNEKDDKATARRYAERLLQLDPEDTVAKQLMQKEGK